MDSFETLRACSQAIEREGLDYFQKESKRLVSVHYHKNIVEGCSVAVTFHSLNCSKTLTPCHLYSASPGLVVFNKIGVLKGISTTEVPRNLMVSEIEPKTLVELIKQSFTPANELKVNTTLYRDKRIIEEVLEKEWECYGDSYLFYVQKLGVDPRLLKSCEEKLLEHSS